MVKLHKRHRGWEIIEKAASWEARKLGARRMALRARTGEELIRMIDEQ